MLFNTSTINDGNMSFRFGENDEVVSNRRRFLKENAADYADTICMRCNHGEYITAVNRGTPTQHFGAQRQEDQIEAEVLVTEKKNIALMLLTADCLPTAFYDPVQEVIALAHLNRKTIAHNLGQKTVGFLAEHHKSNPADIIVTVGPHIKPESYSFPLPLTEPTPPQLAPHMYEENGVVHIDLQASETAQLTKVGVKEENISFSPIDTYTSSEHFSHFESTRDDTKTHGRLATILMMSV